MIKVGNRTVLMSTIRGALLLTALMLCFQSAEAESTYTQQVESRAGGFHAEITLEARAERHPELNRWRATVMDSARNVLYQIEREIPYGSPYPALALSDSGGAGMVLNAFDGIVEVLDSRGTVVRRWRPFAAEEPSHERILKCSVAGQRVAVLASDPTSPPALVYAMELEGALSAASALPEAQGGEIYLSTDGEVIVAGGSTAGERLTVSTSILSWGCSLLDTVGLDFRLADVPAGGTTAVLADLRTVVEIDYESHERRKLWEENRPAAIITALGSHLRGTVVVSQQAEMRGGPARYTGTRLVLITQAGLMLLDRDLEGEATRPAALVCAEEAIFVTLGTTRVSIPIER